MPLLTGRINRRTYIVGNAAIATGLLVANGPFELLDGQSDSLVAVSGYMLIVTALLSLFAAGYLAHRRGQDLGYPGIVFVLLAYFVPLAGLLMAVVPGNKAANKYGPVPPPTIKF